MTLQRRVDEVLIDGDTPEDADDGDNVLKRQDTVRAMVMSRTRQREKGTRSLAKVQTARGCINVFEAVLQLMAGYILPIPPPSFLHNRPTTHCVKETKAPNGSRESITTRGGLSRVDSWKRVKHLFRRGEGGARVRNEGWALVSGCIPARGGETLASVGGRDVGPHY